IRRSAKLREDINVSPRLIPHQPAEVMGDWSIVELAKIGGLIRRGGDALAAKGATACRRGRGDVLGLGWLGGRGRFGGSTLTAAAFIGIGGVACVDSRFIRGRVELHRLAAEEAPLVHTRLKSLLRLIG